MTGSTPWLAWGYYAHAVRTHGRISDALVIEWLQTTKQYGGMDAAIRESWLVGRSIAIRKMLSEWGVIRGARNAERP